MRGCFWVAAIFSPNLYAASLKLTCIVRSGAVLSYLVAREDAKDPNGMTMTAAKIFAADFFNLSQGEMGQPSKMASWGRGREDTECVPVCTV